jgi:hypothetical protein
VKSRQVVKKFNYPINAIWESLKRTQVQFFYFIHSGGSRGVKKVSGMKVVLKTKGLLPGFLPSGGL